MRLAPIALSLGVAAAAWCEPAAAHGPPPFIVGVAAADAVGPNLLVVTEGLVQKRGPEWVYVCPSRFGADPSPIALSADGETTYVVGDHDLFTLDRQGGVTATDAPAMTRGAVIALVVSRGTVYGVRFTETVSDIRSVDGSAPLWTAIEPLKAAHADDDGFWLGAASGSSASAIFVDLDGVEQERRTFAIEQGEAITAIRRAGDSVYVGLVNLQFDTRLVSVATDGVATKVASSTEPLRGLAPLGPDGVWTASDGALYAALPGGSSLVDAPDDVTFVGETGPFGFAAAGTRLFALADDGVGPLAADLADVVGPREHLPDPATDEACQLEWTTFRDDLIGLGVLAAVSTVDGGGDAGRGARAIEAEGPTPTGGCSCRANASHARGASPMGLVLLTFGGLVRRRRAAAKKSAS